MKELTGKNARHPGVEFLRVLAMGMIVLHHLLTHGGLLLAFPEPGPTAAALYLLNTLTCCAVNVYGLISGYVGSGRFRPARLMGLWLQAWFTGAVLTALMGLRTALTAEDWRVALLPVSSQEYWYLTAYFGLYLLTPALHAAIERLSRRQLTLTLLGCGLLFGLMPRSATALSLSGGYHIGWLCVLYLLGGWLRRYGKPARTVRKPLLCFFVCAGAAGGWQVSGQFLDPHGFSLPLDGEWFLAYTSPLMVGAALALFVLFLRVESPARLGRFACWAGPLTFGVYLIHEQPAVRRTLLTLRLAALSGLSAPLLMLALLGLWLAVYGGALALEWLRSRLFVLCRADRLCQRAGERLTAWVCRLLPEEQAARPK